MRSKYILFVFLACLLVFSQTSCDKKKTAPPSSSALSNPYTADAVFVKLKKELDANPKDIDALFHLADLYERNAQYKEEIETLEKVVRLDPKRGYAYFKMGTIYNRLEKPEKALPAFEKAIKFIPGYAVAYNNMGISYAKLGKRKDEIRVLKTAIKLRPDYATAHYNLGMAYLKSGKEKNAREQYDKLMKIDEGAAAALMKAIEEKSS